MESMANKYFETADHAAVYTKFRPATPEALARLIVAYAGEKITGPLKVAVDVGCGSGQSTEALAPFFSEVHGFDPCETAIDEAIKKRQAPNVTYGVGPAEKLNFQDNSVTLVTAGQACHWFNLPAFYEEVKRILIPGGALAVYSYYLPQPEYPGSKPKDLSPIVDKLGNGIMGSYWAPQVKIVADEYRGLNLPLEDIKRDEFVYAVEKATIADLVGFITTWSVFQTYQKQNGKEKAAAVMMDFERELMEATGSKLKPEETEIIVKFKYFLVFGRKAS